jgi:AcrR family transcriptional regulator
MASDVNTRRYERKREVVLAAAQDILYRTGVRGLTMAAVAEKVGLNAASISYYFPKKDDLVTACYIQAVARYDDAVAQARQEPDEERRLRRMIELCFANHRAVRQGELSPIATFADIRALEEPHQSVVREAFAGMFRRARDLFDPIEIKPRSRKARTALAHLLLEQIFWSSEWLHRYDVEDYPRVLERMCDVFVRGVAAPGSTWRNDVMQLQPGLRAAGAAKSREDFLIAATRLINKVGYHGASVEKISAELSVTKGSFYHHNDAKDGLADDCFRRSLELMTAAQRQAMDGEGSHWDKLVRTAATLVDFQMCEYGPLLRTSVLRFMPAPLRVTLGDRLARVVDRYAAMIADGFADGSVRAVDPQIAALTLRVAINAAAEAPNWVRGLERAEAPAFYARPMLMGVLDVDA